MIYFTLRWLMRLVLQVYFKRIFIFGKKEAEHPGPTILACNHPNSFLDAVVLAVILDKPLHFLARSDVFNSPLKRWLLAQMHVIPIYRLEEGAENLSKNQETFTQCYNILKNNGTVLIFSEGLCVLEKRLRPLRKGTARLAFGAEEANPFKLNLEVVPVTLNYTYPTRFREEVIIGVAEPILVKDFEYLQTPAKAINQFNQALTRKLKGNLINIDQPQLEEIIEHLLPLIRTNNLITQSSGWLNGTKLRLWQEKKTAENIHQLFTSNPVLFSSLDMELTEYQQYLATYKISDATVAGIKVSIYKKMLLLAGGPFLLLGLVLNGLPLWLAQVITKRKVKKIEFYSSVRVALGFLLYLFYFLLLMVATLVISPGRFLFVAAALPLTGYLALLYYDNWKELEGTRKINSKTITHLQLLRSRILNILQH